MVLTGKQREDLYENLSLYFDDGILKCTFLYVFYVGVSRHEAILEYLTSMGASFAQSAAAFQQDAGLHPRSTGSTTTDLNQTGLLEKKWTSVVRLQRKVMELECRIQQLEEDAKLGASVVSRRDVTGARDNLKAMLPRAPSKYSMSGHRSPITCVVFHPVFSVLASSSEDATIKVRFLRHLLHLLHRRLI
jgi:platelet-activating factor acetylhydrolase IB subunit alpha